MENPLKNSKDFFNQEDYDRLVKEGVTEFTEYSSLPAPDDPDVKPNASTTASSPQTIRYPRPPSSPPIVNPNVAPIPTQKGGISRRDFIWGSLVLGVAAIGGAAYLSRAGQSLAVPTPVAKVAEMKPTLTPVPSTPAPTTTINLRPVEALVPPTRTPLVAPAIEAKPISTLITTPVATEIVRSPTAVIIDEFAEEKKIFKDFFFGPEAIQSTFGIGINPKDIPRPLFRKSILERAKELNYFLIYRINSSTNGTALTMQSMGRSVEAKYFRDRSNQVNIMQDWIYVKHRYDSFFSKEEPRSGWALVSRGVLSPSVGANFLIQTQAIVEHLEGQIYQGQPPIPEIQSAIDEYDYKRKELDGLLRSNWAEASQRLIKLKINQVGRPTIQEAFYDSLVHFEVTREPLLGGMGLWTNSLFDGKNIIRVSKFPPQGLWFDGSGADRGHYNLGVTPSFIVEL